MRKKRIELEQAVIVAAREFLAAIPDTGIDVPYPDDLNVVHALFNALDALEEANKALNDHDAAELTGQGARWVHGSPETSEQAAALAAPVQGSMRRRIVILLAHDGRMTDEQLEGALHGEKHQTVSSARNWLVNAGWVHDSGYRKLNSSGRAAVMWELTPAGTRQIEDL